MAVMTIAICDEIRKDAQKLYRQLSTLSHRCRAPSVSGRRESSERTDRGTQDLRSDISGAGW